MFLPGIAYKEVSGLHGEVRQLTDMGGIGLCSGLHIVRLKVIDIDALVIEHAIEAVYRKLLVNAVDGGLDVFPAQIEVVLVYRTDGCLVQVSATD